jgi:hypothetical protein
MLIFKGRYKSINFTAPRLPRTFPADHQSVITEPIIPIFHYSAEASLRARNSNLEQSH